VSCVHYDSRLDSRRVLVIGAVLGGLGAAPGCGQSSQSAPDCLDVPDGDVVSGASLGQARQHITFTTTIDGAGYALEAMVYRPQDGNARHPFILLTHGRNGPNPKRNPLEVCSMSPLGEALAAKGYMVMMLVRRGYGASQGPDSEYLETAEDSGFAGAKDVIAGVEYMRGQADVDASKMLLMGHSQGGWVTLAASALSTDGVLGAVNLSGGINFQQEHGKSIRSSLVNEMHMFQSAQIFGADARVPSLWIYAENDNFRTDTVRGWLSGFQQAGGQAALVVKPAYSSGGHYATWQPAVIMDDLMAFFAARGF
jgi:dienelactone hydrolase